MKIGKHKTLGNHRAYVTGLNEDMKLYKYEGYICTYKWEEVFLTCWTEHGINISHERYNLKLRPVYEKKAPEDNGGICN